MRATSTGISATQYASAAACVPAVTASSVQSDQLITSMHGPATDWLRGGNSTSKPCALPGVPVTNTGSEAVTPAGVELDIDGLRMSDSSLGQLPPGKRLQEVVQPDTWQLLLEAERRHGLKLFGLRGFRPWVVALGLTSQALQKAGFSAEQGIDEHFRRAAEGRLRIEALETVDEQLSLFSELSPEAGENLLRQTITEIEHYGEPVAELARLGL